MTQSRGESSGLFYRKYEEHLSVFVGLGKVYIVRGRAVYNGFYHYPRPGLQPIVRGARKAPWTQPALKRPA